MKVKKSILPILFCLLINQLSAQTNYYIATTGNNTNNGLFATPWKTIQYAVDHAGANDTLNILSGTFNEKINIGRSNIYIRKNAGASPVLSGTGITAPVSMVKISSQSNITIDGLEIANNARTDAQGILVDGTSQNITIKNCRIHDIHFSSNPSAPVNSSTNAQGIIVYGTHATTPIGNLKILNNYVYNCRLGYSEGIAVNGNVDGFEISGNSVFDLTNIGIDAIGHEGTCTNPANDQARNGVIKRNVVRDCLSSYATSAGIYVDGGKNIVIENNTSYNNGYGIEVGCENIGKTTDNIIVRNNGIFNNQICAIAFGGYAYPGGSGKVTNSAIRNNACFQNDYSNNGNGELYLSYSENTVIENNVFYTTTQNILAYAELSQPGLSFNYNIFYSGFSPANIETDWNGNNYTTIAAFKTGTNTNANSLVTNPQFVFAQLSSPDSPPDFHLDFLSPAREAGNPSFVAALTERDIDNQVRVSGIVDCGLDEYYPPPVTYTFNGNGDWNIESNWLNSNKPPSTLTDGDIIIIDPAGNGECVLSGEQHIQNNAQLKVNPNKKFRITTSLQINN